MPQLTQGKTRRLMYVENKSERGDRGEARIGWVTFSKTGRTIYYAGKRFQRIKGGGVSGNYYESESGEEYWISGVKKTGSNRHWAGGGAVLIDEDARAEYESIIRGS